MKLSTNVEKHLENLKTNWGHEKKVECVDLVKYFFWPSSIIPNIHISLFPISFSTKIHHSNQYLIAKIFDTAENGPFKVLDWKKGVQVTHNVRQVTNSIRRSVGAEHRARDRGRLRLRLLRRRQRCLLTPEGGSCSRQCASQQEAHPVSRKNFPEHFKEMWYKMRSSEILVVVSSAKIGWKRR